MLSLPAQGEEGDSDDQEQHKGSAGGWGGMEKGGRNGGEESSVVLCDNGCGVREQGSHKYAHTLSNA